MLENFRHDHMSLLIHFVFNHLFIFFLHTFEAMDLLSISSLDTNNPGPLIQKFFFDCFGGSFFEHHGFYLKRYINTANHISYWLIKVKISCKYCCSVKWSLTEQHCAENSLCRKHLWSLYQSTEQSWVGTLMSCFLSHSAPPSTLGETKLMSTQWDRIFWWLWSKSKAVWHQAGHKIWYADNNDNGDISAKSSPPLAFDSSQVIVVSPK